MLLSVQANRALLEGAYRDVVELLAQAEPIARLLDDTIEVIPIRFIGGFAALFPRDAELARRCFREGLLLCREAVLLPTAKQGLLGHAAIAALDGDHVGAARLSGAAAAHRFGERRDPVDLRVQQEFLEPARDALGAEAWEAAATEGAALGFRDAIACAVGEQAWRRQEV